MRILMTGGTAGIGLVAARRLIAAGAELIIGARQPDVAPGDIQSGATLERLDLADLSTVEAFLRRTSRGPRVDVLLANAGLQNVTDGRSAQGLDLTFAANHLAYYLIARRVAPTLAEGGRIIFTSSGTHDPEKKTGMPPPLHADALKLARPETDPARDAKRGDAGRRAYSASKLCNVMTARELARRLADSRSDISVVAYDPGFTPGTGLARDYPPAMSWIFRHIMPLVVRGEHTSTPANSGRLLADLATEAKYAASRGGYFSVHGTAAPEIEPSHLARDADACAQLWDDSAALLADVGFPLNS